jgi:hypothetical protein
MNKILLNVMLFLAAGAGSKVQAQNADSAYMQVVTTRAEKIAVTLGIQDSAQKSKVSHMIALQYFNLNKIYARRDSALKELKEKGKVDEAVKSSIEKETTTSTDLVHMLFLAQLATALNTGQIDKVKDGMTYGVLPITYTGYCDMIPTLTETQKKVILNDLTEAREHAMDAESSDKKHAWFGKYKGRINNYLSKEGYDLQKERAEWEKRMKAAGKKF